MVAYVYTACQEISLRSGLVLGQSVCFRFQILRKRYIGIEPKEVIQCCYVSIVYLEP